MKKPICNVIMLVSILLLSGCASILTGTSQKINLSTPPADGAHCTLTNNKGQWNVQTPGQVKVHKSFNDISIVCKKKGYKTARTKVASNTKAAVFGNAILGGGVGAGVDMADGAAYSYPQNITLPMHK